MLLAQGTRTHLVPAPSIGYKVPKEGMIEMGRMSGVTHINPNTMTLDDRDTLARGGTFARVGLLL